MPVTTVVAPPPRLDIPSDPTGDHATDIANLHTAVQALHEYLGQFHKAAVVESGLLDPSRQFGGAGATFDANAITDPGQATLASAQATANAAYARALLP